MNKPVNLSSEEIGYLRKLNNEQLRLLSGLKDQKVFQVLCDLVNIMVDQDKNYFFAEKEATMAPITLALKHAYVRGAAGRGVMLPRLIIGSSSELLRREEQTRKTKEQAKLKE